MFCELHLTTKTNQITDILAKWKIKNATGMDEANAIRRRGRPRSTRLITGKSAGGTKRQ